MEHRSFIWIYILLLLPLSILQVIITLVSSCRKGSTKFSPTAETTLANNAQALRRGFPLWVVETMRSYQHLTVWTMTISAVYCVLVEIGYRYTNNRYSEWFCPIRTFLPAAGTIVANYWTFIFVFGVWSLVPREDFPKDDEKADAMAHRLFKYDEPALISIPTSISMPLIATPTSVTTPLSYLQCSSFKRYPSWSMYVIVYMIMHVQHTLLPLLAWVEYAWYPGVVNALCPAPTFLTGVTYLLPLLSLLSSSTYSFNFVGLSRCPRVNICCFVSPDMAVVGLNVLACESHTTVPDHAHGMAKWSVEIVIWGNARTWNLCSLLFTAPSTTVY